MVARTDTVYDVRSSIEAYFESKCGAEDVVHDVELCIRTVVDNECGTLEEHRELGLRILKRLGVSPVGDIVRY